MTRKVVTPEQYLTAIYAHGFDAPTTQRLVMKMKEHLKENGEYDGTFSGTSTYLERKLTTTDLYLDISKLGLKSDKFAFMKSLDENGNVVPGADGNGFANNGFKILPQGYALFAHSIEYKDLFSNNPKKVRAAIAQLESPAVEQQPNGEADIVRETELEGWTKLGQDLFNPDVSIAFTDIVHRNLTKAKQHLKNLERVIPNVGIAK